MCGGNTVVTTLKVNKQISSSLLSALSFKLNDWFLQFIFRNLTYF